MSANRNQRLVAEVKQTQPYCSRCAASNDLTAHHITPLADQGADSIENLDVLCGYCHREWHEIEGGLSYTTFLDLPRGDWVVQIMADPSMRTKSMETAVETFLEFRALRAMGLIKRPGACA